MRNLSRADFVLVFFARLLVISAFALIDLRAFYHAAYSLYANKLDEKPQKYFVLDSPDSYVFEAISNPGKEVPINSLDDTQIDDMAATYDTHNVEFNNNYYEVYLITGDPPLGLPLLIMASLVFSATSISIICLFKTVQHLKRKNV